MDDIPETSLIRSRQTTPLPIGSGGKNTTKQQMNQLNSQLTMMTAQATANTKYDPSTPQPITKQVIKETFSSISLPLSLPSISNGFLVIGGLLIVYGLVAK